MERDRVDSSAHSWEAEKETPSDTQKNGGAEAGIDEEPITSNIFFFREGRTDGPGNDNTDCDCLLSPSIFRTPRRMDLGTRKLIALACCVIQFSEDCPDRPIAGGCF